MHLGLIIIVLVPSSHLLLSAQQEFREAYFTINKELIDVLRATLCTF